MLAKKQTSLFLTVDPRKVREVVEKVGRVDYYRTMAMCWDWGAKQYFTTTILY